MAKETFGGQLEGKLLSQIDAAAATNMIASQPLLSEISEMKLEIARLCQAGDAQKARRLAGLLVSRLRAGEPPKE